MGGQRRAGSDRRGVQCLVRRRSSCMPLITAFNLRREDRLPDIENALRRALVSMPELKINDDEIDFVPVSTPDGFHGQVTRINVDLWEGSHRTKAALQELAARAATAFQRVTGSDRKVKVVIRPYTATARNLGEADRVTVGICPESVRHPRRPASHHLGALGPRSAN